MIRINLLAAHKVRKEKDRTWLLKGVILCYIFFLLAAFLGYWKLEGRIQSLKEEKESLEKQTRAASVLQREIRELKQKKELTQARLTLFQNLEKDRHGPVHLMEILSTTLPVNQLWLIALKENGPEIRIDGMSLSNEILAEYMKRLESSSLIKQVDLVQSTQALYKDLKVKQFTLIAWTKVPMPPAPPAEKK
ncbi:MAG: PilN domain-containing protein [Pseudomonadota bacterium]